MKDHHKYQFVVLCGRCGIQPLHRDEYLAQMRAASRKWECPVCGETAAWDDECLETNPADCPYCLEQSMKVTADMSSEDITQMRALISQGGECK